MAVLDKNPPVGSDNEKTGAGVTRAFSQSIEYLGLSGGDREGTGGSLRCRKV